MSIVLVMLSNHLSLCCPLLLLSIFPSIRVFSNELALRIRWPKYWSFSCSLSNDYLGLISFRIDWFDFFAIHGILKRLLWPPLSPRVFMATESVMLSNHLILYQLLLLLSPIFPRIRVFSNESALSIRWPKYWSISISPSNKYSELISFRIDWFDFFAIQRTLKSLLQHNSKASVLQCSAFFTVQLSHPYMTTGKTIALTI